MSGAIVIAGAAHLELVARAGRRSNGAGGSLSIEVGGVGCRAALEAAQCGAEVRLLTAMRESAYSHLIASHLAGYGVRACVEYREELATGGSSAHLDARGRVLSAVRTNPLEQVAAFDETVAAPALEGAAALVLAGELASSAIAQLARLALSRGLRLYGLAAPQGTASRFGPVAAALRGLFLAEREARRLRLDRSRRAARTAQALGLAPILAGEQAMLCFTAADGKPERLTVASARRSPCDALETFAARAVVLHELHGLDLAGALERAPWIGAALGEGALPAAPQLARGAFEQAIGRWRQQALYDSLTGALNRASAEWELHQLLERRSSEASDALAVLMLDIDHFKSVNDTYGHVAGDAVITEVCRIARGCLRSADFIGRWGGEEFLVVLPGASRADAGAIAERMRRTVEAGISHPRPVTVSIGVADAAGGTLDMRTLVEQADQALYAAKRAGRNRVCCGAFAEEIAARTAS